MQKFLTKFAGLAVEKKVYVCIITLTLLLNVAYHLLNTAPQIWDSAAHINLSMLYANKIKELKFTEMLTLSGYYPPFVHLTGSVIFLLFPFFNSPLITTFLFTLIGIVYIYKLCRLLTHSVTVSLFSSAVFVLIPQVFTESRLLQLDLPLTVLITAAIYHLMASNTFSTKKHTLLFFLMAALAQLTKWYAFLYLLVPLISQLLALFNKKDKQEGLFNILKGQILSVLLVVPWYAINRSSILNFFTTVASLGELNDPQNLYSLTNFLEYFYLSFSYQLSFPLFLLIAISLAFLIFNRSQYGKIWILSVIIPLACFMLFKNKDVRYIMPLLPFYVISLATLLNSIKNQKSALALKTVVLGYLSILFILLSFNQVPHLPKSLSFISYAYSFPTNKYQWLGWATNEYAYKRENWNLINLFNHLAYTLDQNPSKNGKILFAVDYPYFNSINFDSLQIYNETYYKITAGYNIASLDLGNSFEDIKKTLYTFDYIITAYNPGDANLRHYNKMVQINRFIQQQGDTYFESKALYKLPNGEEVYLFKNTKQNSFIN